MWKFGLLVTFAFVLVAQCQLTPTHSETDIKEGEREFLVPDIPTSLEESEYSTSRFVFIWANRLHQRNQSGPPLKENDPSRPEPAIILIPSEFHMLNMVPTDAPNPLYSSRFTDLTDDFLLNSMSLQHVESTDNRFSTPEGLTAKTVLGKDLVFKKDPKTNVLSVNGLTVESVNPVVGSNPNILIYNIDGLLFDFRQKIDDAFQILARDAANHPNHPLIKPRPPVDAEGAAETPQ